VPDRLAVLSLVGVAAITFADAPNWSLRPYVGFLGAMAAVGLVSTVDQGLGDSLGLLVVSAVILRRGRAMGENAARLVGAGPLRRGGRSGGNVRAL